MKKSKKGLRAEFTGRLDALESEGMVDFKAEIDVNNHSTAHDLVHTYNNLLRLRDQGAPEPLRIK